MLINSVVKFSHVLLYISVIRHLYSKDTLGLESFKYQQEKTKLSLGNILDKFKTKMRDYSADDSKNMIFTEDLKNMVHLTEDDNDIELVIKMMKRFNNQNKELRFGNFIFGTVVMRMFHNLNKPDEALQCFKSPELKGFFDQLMSYQILLDLLYDNGKYKEMLEVFEIIKERQIEGTKYPRNIVVLTFAACYKLNNQESFDYAMKLWAELKETGHLTMRRGVTFLAGLAHNMGKPEACLEILSTTKNQSYTTVRNLKVISLLEVGRLEDTIPILKGVISEDVSSTRKHTFNKEVMEKVKEATAKCDSADLKMEMERLDKLFREQGHISDLVIILSLY